MNAADELTKYRIPPELLLTAGVRHATDSEVRQLLGIHGRIGQDLSGLVFPCSDPRDSRLLGHRVRLDFPADGQRYISEQGCRFLFFPRTYDGELTDTSIPVVVVEAEKSALALAALSSRCGRRMLLIAAGGVWGWKRKTGVELMPDGQAEPVTGPSPSLDLVCWTGRKAVIAFDSNVAGRRDLQKARLSLAEELAKRGAQVFFATVPLKDGVNGPDDLIALAGDQAALGMLEQAAQFTPFKATVQPEKRGFKLTTLRALLNEPEEKIVWLLADKLPAGGISVLCAKPKVGKSTLARCLALAVARGEPFLGCETVQGPVIYLALEEKRSEVRRHFADLGATGEEPIHIHCAAAPKDAMSELCKLMRELRPALVIIDPLFKFVRIADEKAYAEVCQAIEPLLILGRETGSHVMLVHHSGKADRADATDAILGSTAIFGGVDAALILKRTDRYRTLQSSQRYGVDWPETVLEFDADTRSLSLGVEKTQADVHVLGGTILAYLESIEEPKTEPEIVESVEGKTGLKRKALRQLVEAGKIVREGTGKRGDPFKYAFSFPCSLYIPGSKEQETEKGAETRKNTSDILVPDSQAKPFLVPSDGQGEKPAVAGGLFASEDDDGEVRL